MIKDDGDGLCFQYVRFLRPQMNRKKIDKKWKWGWKGLGKKLDSYGETEEVKEKDEE